MKKGFKKRSTIILTVTFVIIFVLSGCRPSPALERIIYTADATEVDIDHKKKEQDERRDDADKDEDFNNDAEGARSGDVDTENVNPNGGSAAHETEDLGSGDDGSGSGVETDYSPSGTDAQTEGETKPTDNDNKNKSNDDVKPDDDAVEEGDSGIGDADEETPEDPGNGGGGEEEPEPDDGGTDDPGEGGEEENPGDEPGPGEEDENGDDGPGDDGGEEGGDEPDPDRPHKDLQRKSINWGGIEQEVPINCDTVAACGYAAQFVQMLGGEGRLIATDSQYSSSYTAQSITDVQNASVLWNADGSAGISEDNFNALIEAFPDAVFEISGDYTLSEGQISELNDLGIGYVVVPRPSKMDNIVNGAKIVAEVLTDHNDGRGSMGIAESYESWCNDLLSSVNSGDSQVYSTYVSDWLSDVEYEFTQKNYSVLPVDWEGYGYGVAVGYTGAAQVPVTSMLASAGVTNESASTGNALQTKGVFLTPMFNDLSPVYYNYDDREYSVYYGSLPHSVDWGLVHPVSGADPVRVGENNFKTIITADNYVRDNLINSWYWQWHDVIHTGLGDYTAAYVDLDTSEVFWSSIGGDYYIEVNPSGLGHWAKGSVDSPLEAYWAACRIRGSISEDNLRSKMREFYETFYNVSADDGLLETILYGE